MASAAGPRAATEGHVAELDGFRGVAILAVMLLHFVATMFRTPQNVVERVLAKVTGYGMWGVDLFFVLSGFLITGILWDTRASSRYFKAFYMRRTLRIFPLYYGVLVVMLLLIPRSLLQTYTPEALETREAQVWLWTYLSNVYCAKEGGFALPYLSHFWTLAIEEHFYLFWPLVIRLAERLTAMRIAVGLSILALALRLLFNQVSDNEMWGRMLTPCRLDSLCCGAWFALAIRGPAGAQAVGDRWQRWLLASGAALGLLMVTPQSLVPHDVNLPLKETALAVFAGSLIFAAAWRDGPRWLKTPMRAGWLRFFGKYSYGLYVFHSIIAYGCWRHNTAVHFQPLVGSYTTAVLLQAALGCSVSLLIAMASYHLFEMRFLALKKWFTA